jgi:hypothetical protein
MLTIVNKNTWRTCDSPVWERVKYIVPVYNVHPSYKIKNLFFFCNLHFININVNNDKQNVKKYFSITIKFFKINFLQFFFALYFNISNITINIKKCITKKHQLLLFIIIGGLFVRGTFVLDPFQGLVYDTLQIVTGTSNCFFIPRNFMHVHFVTSTPNRIYTSTKSVV